MILALYLKDSLILKKKRKKSRRALGLLLRGRLQSFYVQLYRISLLQRQRSLVRLFTLFKSKTSYLTIKTMDLERLLLPKRSVQRKARLLIYSSARSTMVELFSSHQGKLGRHVFGSQ